MVYPMTGSRAQIIFCLQIYDPEEEGLLYFQILWKLNVRPDWAGLSLGGDLGEKSLNNLVDFSWEKFKCIEHIGKSKIWTTTSLWNPENVA